MRDEDEVRVELSDARAIRAIAHEVRQQVITILYAEQQPMTATQLAGRTSLSPSALSYHLRALERWGVVVRDEAADGDGRNRPWRAAGTMISIRAGRGPGDAAAADALFETMLEEQRHRIRHLRTLPEPVQKGFTSMNVANYWLTPDEIVAVQDEVYALLRNYRDREPEGEGRRRVAVTYSVLPAVPS